MKEGMKAPWVGEANPERTFRPWPPLVKGALLFFSSHPPEGHSSARLKAAASWPNQGEKRRGSELGLC